MFDNIRGIIYFRADGDKIYPFINAIKSEGIVCKNQKCINNSFYGKIYADSWNILCSTAEKYGISVTIEKKKGMRYKVLRYKKRYGFLAGLIIIPAFMFFISDTIVVIEINGNEKNSDRQIISALEDIGIKKGARISDINFTEAENKLRLNLDNVVWSAIRHTGCRVVIDIDESEEEPDVLKERMPANISASRDAQIVSVNVLMGQLVKMVNEGVKEGDIIISGVYSDSKGKINYVHSLGNVIGIYNESVVFSQNFNSSERNPTGDVTEQKYFEMFGFRIPLFIKKDLPYDYEYTENISPLMLYDNRLPFSMVKTQYIEYETSDVVYSEEETESLLMEKVIRYENNFMKDIEILERDIQKNKFDDRIEYIVNYKLKGEIGETSEIFINDKK